MGLFQLISLFTFFYIAFSEDRIPAVPLVVKSPYLSTWVTSPTKHLFGDWPKFWTGAVKGMAGLIKVDGKTYEFMGHPTADPIGTTLQVVQKNLRITPTQSIFTLEAGPVELTANFFTPIDPTDLKLLSLPGSFISLSARSTDKAKHKVEIYFDISAEWAGGNDKESASWSFNNKISNGKIFNFDFQLKNQKVLQETNDQAEWGTTKFFTDSGVTYEAGPGAAVRSEFVKNSKLNDKIDDHSRPINENWPVFAYARDLGELGDQTHTSFYGIAFVRRPGISYTTGTVNSLWESYFKGDSNAMIEFIYDDRDKALERAHALDTKIVTAAHQVGGDSYVKIVSAALRQAIGGTELVGTPEKPWLMLKEISSDGNCQTVDVIYPHFPVLYYLNPLLIKLELDPLLDNQEGGHFPRKYSMHDLGSSYPRCVGHTDGREEAMEVEESANMIIMAAAYFKATKDVAFVKQHYKILKQWSEYCVDHGLFTGNALTTDDFLGPMKNSTNLSIKAIVALAAMVPLATTAGNAADATHFKDVSQNYIKQWQTHGQDAGRDHFKASYNDNSQWFLLYNFYADRLLGTNIIPSQVYKEQDAWYLKNAKKYGVQLTSTKTFTKNDWEMFYAAASESNQLKQLLFDTTALWLRETKSDAPFSDWVDINNGNSPGFRNRPVIGGVFAPLTIGKH